MNQYQFFFFVAKICFTDQLIELFKLDEQSQMLSIQINYFFLFMYYFTNRGLFYQCLIIVISIVEGQDR
jgi:hypothetical protein